MSKPLISVCIITYNSSATVVETLESIKNQTYSEKELIISDDCSKDDTVEVVLKWLSENGSSFVRTELITADHNHGTAVNLDYAVRAAQGTWIKILAGDDCLTPDCLEVFEAETHNSDAGFYICDIQPFVAEGELPRHYADIYSYFFHCAGFCQQKKLRRNLFRLELAGPAFFFSKTLYESVYPGTPEYSMLDEWPLIIGTLLSGNDIIPVHHKLVRYRINAISLSHQNKSIGNKVMLTQNRDFFNNVLKKELKKRHMWFHMFNQEIYYAIRARQFDIFEKSGKVNSHIFRLYQLLPLSLYRWISRQITIRKISRTA